MRRLSPLISILFASAAWGSLQTIEESGIDSKATGLDGTGIQIGQVEAARSGKWGCDSESLTAENTIPAGVYARGTGGMAAGNEGIDPDDPHATLYDAWSQAGSFAFSL